MVEVGCVSHRSLGYGHLNKGIRTSMGVLQSALQPLLGSGNLAKMPQVALVQNAASGLGH
jgi:hypothetical protein